MCNVHILKNDLLDLRKNPPLWKGANPSCRLLRWGGVYSLYNTESLSESLDKALLKTTWKIKKFD